MNRVRVVAIAAVVIGTAVTVGTGFQLSPGGGGLDAQQTALPVASPVASVADTPRTGAPSLVVMGPAVMPDTPTTGAQRVAAVPALIAHPAEAVDAPVTTASILPHAALPLAPIHAVSPADLPLGLAQITADPLPLPLDPLLQAELDACAVWLVVTPSVGAMLDASLYAPCDRDAEVAISHAGLTFDARIGSDGQLMIQVPALIESATVTIDFADGRSASDSTTVVGLSGIERVALQWQGPADLRLQAYEFGAAWGQPGHVNADNPMSPGLVDQGFLTALGDAAIQGGRQAQVYSYPRGLSSRTGQVVLEIEIPVTEASCGQSLDAQTMELHGTVSAQVRAIRLNMPACDGNGGYVVLPGVLPELQIALN